MKRKTRVYSLAFKLKVLQEVESGEESVRTVSAKYGINSRSLVYHWFNQRHKGTLRSPVESSHYMVNPKISSQLAKGQEMTQEKEINFLKLKIHCLQIWIEELKLHVSPSVKKKLDSLPLEKPE